MTLDIFFLQKKMSVQVNLDDLSVSQLEYMEDNYNIFPRVTEYNPTPEPIAMMKCSDGENMTIPFAGWTKFHTKFPEKQTWKKLNENRKSSIVVADDQKTCLNEATNSLMKKHYAFFHLPTASGKTVLSLYLMIKLGYKTLMVCTIKSIHLQWQDSIEKFTNLTVAIIENSTKKWNHDADVIICTPIMAEQHIKKEIKDQIGFLVIDEAHKIPTPTNIPFIFEYQPEYILCCTATHDRPDGMEQILFLLAGNKEEFVWREKTKKFDVICYKTGITPVSTYHNRMGKRTLDYDTFLKSIYLNEKRHKIVHHIIDQNKDKIFFVLGAYTAELSALYELLTNNGIEVVRSYDKFKRENKKHSVFLANFKKGGVGFDDARYNAMILLTSYKDVRQYEGRLRGENGIIWDLVDNAPFLFKEHFKKNRLPWFEKRGATIKYESYELEQTKKSEIEEMQALRKKK